MAQTAAAVWGGHAGAFQTFKRQPPTIVLIFSVGECRGGSERESWRAKLRKGKKRLRARRGKRSGGKGKETHLSLQILRMGMYASHGFRDEEEGQEKGG